MNQNLTVGRLAPSPTGAQHLGNARTFLLAWLSARLGGGKIYLRMEDIDSPRIKPWATMQAIQDLHWLGLDWDAAPIDHQILSTKHPSGDFWTQTDRVEVYHEYLEQLKSKRAVYPCTCSRKDIQDAASAPHANQDATIYPGTCQSNTVATANRFSGIPYAWRMGFSRSQQQFQDTRSGPQICNAKQQLGDFVVARSNGSISYQLATTADDYVMGVNQVVRGDDLIPSTFRQMEIANFFRWPIPAYVHVPLVVGPDGRRLAKRHGDTRLSEIRRKNIGPEKLLGLIVNSCGLSPNIVATTASELLDRLKKQYRSFPWDLIPPSPFVLTPEMWQQVSS